MSAKERQLSSIATGESARITCIRAKEPLHSRLADLGFIPGAKISCLFSAPSGDPRAYQICGAIIALRNHDSAAVWVKSD